MANAKKTVGKAPVTARALIQRLNRRLKADGEVIKMARGERAQQSLGRYFLVLVESNGIGKMDVDLEKMGRQTGCLQNWEYLTEED